MRLALLALTLAACSSSDAMPDAGPRPDASPYVACIGWPAGIDLCEPVCADRSAVGTGNPMRACFVYPNGAGPNTFIHCPVDQRINGEAGCCWSMSTSPGHGTVQYLGCQ